MSLKTRQLNELFQRWKASYGAQAKDFAEDGIIEEAQWDAVTPKVLFLMKSTRGVTGSLNALVAPERPPPEARDWRRVLGCWAFGFHHLTAEAIPSFKHANQHWQQAFRSSAILHAKKLASRTWALGEELRAAVQRDASRIREELDIIQPDVIVCCGTFDSVANIKPILPSAQPVGLGDQCVRHGNTYWIKWSHPSYWIKRASLPFSHVRYTPGMEYEPLMAVWQHIVSLGGAGAS